MNALRALIFGSRRGTVCSVAHLGRAIAEGAAYLAQGASYSYIRARAGPMGPQLFEDPGFISALERCKWEGFAACAQDLALIIEAELRPLRPTPAAFWKALYRQVLELEGVPEHRREEGWADRIAEFEARLGRHLAAPPAGIAEIAAHSGRVIVEFAPVEPAIRETDREMVINNTCLRFIEHVDALRRRVDWRALAAEIAGRPDAGGSSG